MNGPVLVVYGRVTERGVIRFTGRRNRRMLSFILAAQIEQLEPVDHRGRYFAEVEERRRRPWWLRCIASTETEMKKAASLGPHSWVSVTGRLQRQRVLDRKARWREEWTLFIDTLSTMNPGASIDISMTPGEGEHPAGPESVTDPPLEDAPPDSVPQDDAGAPDPDPAPAATDGEPLE